MAGNSFTIEASLTVAVVVLFMAGSIFWHFTKRRISAHAATLLIRLTPCRRRRTRIPHRQTLLPIVAPLASTSLTTIVNISPPPPAYSPPTSPTHHRHLSEASASSTSTDSTIRPLRHMTDEETCDFIFTKPSPATQPQPTLIVQSPSVLREDLNTNTGVVKKESGDDI